MSGTSKANQRQSRHRKPRYQAQKDKTPINKIIAMVRHIANFGDRRMMDKLKQMPAIDRKRAFQQTESDRYKAVIQNSY